MFKKIKTLIAEIFARQVEKPAEKQISMPDEVIQAFGNGDVLRYPPAEKGYPAKIPGYALLSLQSEIISNIKRELMVRDSEFEEYVQPMLNNFANFVHLLPASEYHHHRAQGGLLRHTLEVIYFSIKIAKSFEFDANENPVTKSDRALAWRFAVVIGAVMHDIGKPISDVEIWDQSGEQHWMPTDSCIHEWAEEKQFERYFIYWRSDRHERHHNTSLTKMTDIVPKKLLAFLMEEGNDIYNELTEALAGSNSFRATASRSDTGTAYKNKIHKIVSTADTRSVKQDLKRYSGDAVRAAQTGVPVIARVIDAIRQLVKKGEWRVNKAGSPIWYTTEGLFITWGTSIPRITEIVKESGVNIPHSADSLADIMLSYHLCVTNEDDSVYWRMAPHILNDKNSRTGKEPKNALSCLKLSDPIIIFQDDSIPNPTSCRIKLADGWREFLASGARGELNESRAYIGKKPSERSLPTNIDPEILKGGSLPPTSDTPPDGDIVRQGNANKPKNIVEHMLRINLLTPETAAAIQKRDADEKKLKEEAVKATPVQEQTASSEEEFSDKDIRNENTTNTVKNRPPATADQGTLFADEYESIHDTDDDSDDSTGMMMEQYQAESAEPSAGSLSLRERMEMAQINQKYQDDEKNIQLDEKERPVNLWEDARRRLRDSQDITDGYEKPAGESPTTPTDIPGILESGYAFSSMFKNAPDDTQLLLRKYVKERSEELFADTFHFFIHIKDDEDEEAYTAMVAAGWVWTPFLTPNVNFQMFKSKPGFFLKRGLNEDIDHLSGGVYLRNIYPFNPDDVYCDENDLYRAIASYGQVKPISIKQNVISLSGSAIRNMGKSLELDTNKVRFLIYYHFDSVNKRGSEHILVDDRVKPYMVDYYE